MSDSPATGVRPSDRPDGASNPRGPDRRDRPADESVRQRLDRLVKTARLTLWWERAWPALWWPLAVLIVFLTLSWLGVWLEATPTERMVGIAAF